MYIYIYQYKYQYIYTTYIYQSVYILTRWNNHGSRWHGPLHDHFPNAKQVVVPSTSYDDAKHYICLEVKASYTSCYLVMLPCHFTCRRETQNAQLYRGRVLLLASIPSTPPTPSSHPPVWNWRLGALGQELLLSCLRHRQARAPAPTVMSSTLC